MLMVAAAAAAAATAVVVVHPQHASLLLLILLHHGSIQQLHLFLGPTTVGCHHRFIDAGRAATCAAIAGHPVRLGTPGQAGQGSTKAIPPVYPRQMRRNRRYRTRFHAG